ncbi:AMP-binding protein, partial [Bifidobacterium breve]
MPENIADKANNDTHIVKQFTNPVKEPIDSDINLFDLLDERARRDPDGAMIEYKTEDGTWQPYSAQVFRDMVIDLAKGLIGLGVNKGDSVAIVSRTRWEWTALDMAIMSIGALTVPVYETNSASQVSWIFNDSKVTLAIAEDDGQRDKIESVRSEVPTLRNVFVIEAGGLNAIKTYGESVTDAEFREYKNASHGDDRATIVYTSGSTGTPKGVELTHRNFAFLVRSALQYMPRAGAWPNRRLLLFLPLSHVFARFMEFFSFGGTISLALSSNMKTMVKDFETFGPTLLL